MRFLLIIFLVGLAVLGSLYALKQRPEAPAVVTAATNEACAPSDALGGAFTLTDQNGARVTDQTYRGKYLLVEFGFTNCPDICPMQLATAEEALAKLGDKAKDIQPLFITVDPARDTPAVLKPMLTTFPRFTGLTGSAAEIDQVARAYKVYYARVPVAGQPNAYTMDHSIRIFLMNPDGKFLRMFQTESADEIAAGITRCMK